MLDDVDPVELVTVGHRRQEFAFESGEVDEVEAAAPRIHPLARKQAAAQLQLLSSLLYRQPTPRPMPIPYVPDMSLDAEARRKQKTTHMNRERRRLKRWEEQERETVPQKAVAVKRVKLTVSEAVVTEFKPTQLGGWSGPQNASGRYPLNILSVPDALSCIGLTLYKWGGRQVLLILNARHGLTL